MSGLAPEIFADHSLSSQRAFARGVSTVPKQHRLKDDFIMLTPVDMSLHNKSRRFDIAYEDGSSYSFTFEFLRVFSPSADVQGHTPDEAKLQVGKRDVTIVAAEPVGSYALRFVFSDGHDSGIYSWEYLAELGKQQEGLWEAYLEDLKRNGASRDPNDPANARFADKPKATCPSHQH